MSSLETAETPRRDPADLLTISFGTVVAMWGVGYVARLPGITLPSAALFFLLLACLVAGGVCLGRYTHRGAGGAVWVGVVTSLVNLLILGSVISRETPADLLRAAVVWVPANLLISVGGALAGWCLSTIMGRARVSHVYDAAPINWRAAFVGVAIVATLLLLAVGGVVTGFKAGLAVVDWPNSFGYNMFLYPLSKMTGPIYYEHSHRLFGSLVGLTTLVLAAYLHRCEPDRGPRLVSKLALAAVIVQGVMGGLRVTGKFTLSTSAEQTAPNLALAIVHGVFAQVCFCLLVGLRVSLASAWRARQAPAASLAAQRIPAVILALAILLQVLLGALYRHSSESAWLYAHIGVAIGVILIGLVVGMRIWAGYEALVDLSRAGGRLLVMLGVQLALGMAALMAVALDGKVSPQAWHVLITTAHQTAGALLLAAAVVMMLWTLRLSASHRDHPTAASAPVLQTS